MIAVINSGSTSLKAALFDSEGRPVAKRTFEEIEDREETLRRLLQEAPFSDSSLKAVIHRIVHGGKRLSTPVRIDDVVYEALRDAEALAPLHMPANLEAVDYFRRHRPDLVQIAVFDTAFHATIPERAARYALNRELSERLGVRRYGFHGISYAYLLKESTHRLGKANPTLIAMHLGGGASICAIEEGRSVDTSMGMTPLEGLVMATRCGDLDPGIAIRLMREREMDARQLEEMLYKRSGLKALSGRSDMREILSSSHPDAVSAIEIYTYRIVKYIGAYLAILKSFPDALVFAGGVGEHASEIRARILAPLEKYGIVVDNEANARNASSIATPESRCPVYVVETDEESEMVAQSAHLWKGAV